MFNKKLIKNYIFFFISIIFLFFISTNNNKNFHIITYSVPAYNFKDSVYKTSAYGLGTMGFQSLALTAFSEAHELTRKISIRHAHYTTNYQISWLINKEKFFKIKKELTPEKLLDISKTIFSRGEIINDYIRYLNFIYELNDTTKFEIEYDEIIKDFHINYNNMKISYIRKHLEQFYAHIDKNINSLDILKKDEIKKLIKIQSMYKEDIKKSIFNNYNGTYFLDFKNRNYLKSVLNIENIDYSNINFVSRDIYKLSKRYIENNTYFYNTPPLKEKDLIIENSNKIQNLKITDCKNSLIENQIKLNCKYFPLEISEDGLILNFF